MLKTLLRTVVPFYQENLDSKLILAAKQGDVNQVKSLLEQGANVNATDEYGMTSLHMVAMVDIVEPQMRCLPYDLQITELLLSRGANSSICSNSGQTPVHHAVHCKKFHLLQLLANESNINMGLRYSALHLAVELGLLEGVKVLAGIDTIDWNLPDKNGKTPLMIALKKSWTHALNGEHDEFKAYEPILNLLLERSDITLAMPMLYEQQRNLGAVGKTPSCLIEFDPIINEQVEMILSNEKIVNTMINQILDKSGATLNEYIKYNKKFQHLIDDSHNATNNSSLHETKDSSGRLCHYNKSSEGLISISRWQELLGQEEVALAPDIHSLPAPLEKLGDVREEGKYMELTGGLHYTSPFSAS